MTIYKPSIRQDDPLWYSRLKETILEIIDELNKNELKGDGTTTRVTREGDGATVHADTVPYLWEATEDASNGTIKAKLVNKDGSLSTPEQTFSIAEYSGSDASPF